MHAVFTTCILFSAFYCLVLPVVDGHIEGVRSRKSYWFRSFLARRTGDAIFTSTRGQKVDRIDCRPVRRVPLIDGDIAHMWTYHHRHKGWFGRKGLRRAVCTSNVSTSTRQHVTADRYLTECEEGVEECLLISPECIGVDGGWWCGNYVNAMGWTRTRYFNNVRMLGPICIKHPSRGWIQLYRHI